MADMPSAVVYRSYESYRVRLRQRQGEEAFAKINKLDRQMVEGVLLILT